eukprot:12964140-Alexandrium_andersonii.AAC.1
MSASLGGLGDVYKRQTSSSPRGTPPTTSVTGDDGAATPASTVGVMGAAAPPLTGMKTVGVT